MRALGVETTPEKIIFTMLEQDPSQVPLHISCSPPLLIGDHRDNQNLRQLKAQIEMLITTYKPDQVGLIAKAVAGRMSAAPVAIKIEALFQLIPEVNVKFVSQQTIAAYLRKVDKADILEPKFKYQVDTNHLAHYLLSLE